MHRVCLQLATKMVIELWKCRKARGRKDQRDYRNILWVRKLAVYSEENECSYISLHDDWSHICTYTQTYTQGPELYTMPEKKPEKDSKKPEVPPSPKEELLVEMYSQPDKSRKQKVCWHTCYDTRLVSTSSLAIQSQPVKTWMNLWMLEHIFLCQLTVPVLKHASAVRIIVLHVQIN